jgi:hypothetical protein
MSDEAVSGFDAQRSEAAQWDLSERVYERLRTDGHFALPPAMLARLVLSDVAAFLSDVARCLVPTEADGHAEGGEFADQASRVAAEAQVVLAAAVVYERARGTSWTDIGEALGVSEQAAQERFRADVVSFEAGLDTPYTLGGVGQILKPNLPEAALAPRRVAARLDRWVLGRGRPDERGGAGWGRVGERPVSAGTVDRDDHRAAVLSSAVRAARDRLSRSLQRRIRTPLIVERMLLEREVACWEAALIERPGDTDARDALGTARARLAQLRGSRR